MTPEDQANLATLASSSIINIIDVVIISVGYGALILMTYIALRTLSMKPYKPSKKVFICCWAMLIIFTVVMIYIASFTFDIISGPAQKLGANAANNQIIFWSYMGPIVQAIPIVIGDGVVVWRAWVLLPEGRYWKMLVTTIMAANICVNVVYCVADDIFTLGQIEGFGTSWDWIALLVSLTVNVSMTLFIMWKWWDNQGTLRTTSSQNRSQLRKVFLLMIESGAIFCAMQSLTLIFTMLAHYIENAPLELIEAVRLINAIFRVATAWYPAAVIILIDLNKATVKTANNSSGMRNRTFTFSSVLHTLTRNKE
ncbi:hypothetical protein GYMLUDRAFT_45058 [Collybiopsis luxurians FD-317 M1]|uniref:Uncharacterized protein n=1 Tax=Collybiopsis luxurians FD-317 M1 TaxID=944289 RepID=A0A0D0B5T8_9AGAR|nr:hypothetical protein GYMLUDRAFT_45058 [Collybiopsis luxurians FD-317 M1]